MGSIPVGTQFGSWTVVGDCVTKERTTYYPCRCVCGTERLVHVSSLKSGRSRSCGCIPFPDSRKDLTGQQLGYWTVLERMEDEKGLASYRCRCICGTERVVKYYELKEMKDSSCGCVKREKARERTKEKTVSVSKDEIGKQFGFWTVLALDEKPRKFRQRYYICRCVCGKEQSVRRSELLNGNSQSCGCKAAERISKTKKSMPKD